MRKSFRNRVIWITGASSGIGEALAYELAKSGAKLILSARRKEELERVKGNCIAAAQPGIRVLPFDLSEPSTLQLATQAAIQTFGFVDILICNGGIGQSALALETSLDDDRRIMEVNYFACISLTKFLLPHFYERRTGQYVIVSSVLGKFSTPGRSAYAASKHALHGFYDALRGEIWQSERNIHVTVICPGWVKTNLRKFAIKGTSKASEGSRPAGMSAQKLAVKMLRAIAAKKNEVFIGGSKEKNAVRIKRFFPSLLNRLVRKRKPN